ncbi:ROK family transcriptional regulator [Paenibacillus sp. UMB4589-SE434]|uniref:ROK family transcriptional regulator n=1 Tax=Paenibacillus sp. UMB4589-SE434 TaxID=3046314 RepID=UPI002551222F|nr:ROK family transcriptional regulator [Paenibacillus sp. UMB4589-SE434]MDK8182172.1 ROK family transcriptional regulator [Paenibacillus sp. UMB4589-SE434]
MKPISGNALVIKEINMNLVRQMLKAKGTATKQEIALATGLSVVTVNTVLQSLVKQGEVMKSGLSSSSGGRPAMLFAYHSDYALALILYPLERDGCIQIHGTVVNLSGDPVYETDVDVDQLDVAQLESIIDRLLAAYPSIQAIGLGLPGAEYEGKMIVSDYQSLLGVSLAEHLRVRYNRPIIIENDVNAAVIGFSNRMRVTPEQTVVYFYFPQRYAPGAGIFMNGRLYKGKGNFAGEVANIPLGIPWGDWTLANTFDTWCSAIAKLTVAVSSVLNPDLVVLCGHRIEQVHVKAVIEQCSTQLPQSAVPHMFLSEDFAADYLSGMIVQTLDTLESGLVLQQKR